jgi:hypothetical protein
MSYPSERAITAGLVDVRAAPSDDAERVTQALCGSPAQRLEAAEEWVRVHLPDYDGWVHRAALAAPPRAGRVVAVVRALRTPLYVAAEGDATLDTVYASTVLPAEGAPGKRLRAAVRLPGGRLGWISSDAVALRPAEHPFAGGEVNVALELAHHLLGVPYLWGGASPEGIDCSGLVQLCYRVAGLVLPRDARQQFAALPTVVERADLRPGDLLFFAEEGAITHVALSLGGDQLLHASGSGRRVMLDTLAPGASARGDFLARIYAGARRPLPA